MRIVSVMFYDAEMTEQADAWRLLAAVQRQQAAVRALADQGADRTLYNSQVLVFAAQKGNADLVQALLDDPRARPDGQESEALASAACAGHTEVVRLLLRDGRADPNRSDELSKPALENAGANGHVDVVCALLADGRANPAANDSRALQEAAKAGHTEVVRALLEDRRADPTAQESRALTIAALHAKTEVVRAVRSILKIPVEQLREFAHAHAREPLSQKRPAIEL